MEKAKRPLRKVLNACYFIVPLVLKRWVLEARLWLSLPDAAIRHVRIRFTTEPDDAESRSEEKEKFVRFERFGNCLTMWIAKRRLAQDSYTLNYYWKRLPIMVQVLSNTNVTALKGNFDISDGNGSNPDIRIERPILAFSSNDDDAILVPDRFFMSGRNYAPYRKLAKSGTSPWRTRSNTVLWRGSPNGHGELVNRTMQVTDETLKQRVRLCLAARLIPYSDIRLVGINASNAGEVDLRVLHDLSLIGNPIPSTDWFHVKYAIDIDGFTNAWSNLYTRLLLGCCVLKVQSPQGFKQWYYDELRPWKHYVPVSANLEDLGEKIAWCRSHESECEAIALEGQRFALNRTPQSECRAIADRMTSKLSQRAA